MSDPPAREQSGVSVAGLPEEVQGPWTRGDPERWSQLRLSQPEGSCSPLSRFNGVCCC